MNCTQGGLGDDSHDSLDSGSLTDAVEWYARQTKIKMATRNTSTRADLHVVNRRIGPIRVARSHSLLDLTMTTSSAEVYAVAVVSAGGLRVSEAGREWRLTPAVAGLYRPPRALRANHIAAGTEMTYLQIGRHDLERQLEELIGQYVAGPVDFGPELPLHGAPAWLRIFRAFTGTLDEPASALHRPLINEPLREALINAVLYTADHPYRAALHREVAPARPRHVRLVVDAIRAEPERVYTAASLARIAGVSVRSLQQGFRDHVGMAPTAYVRRIRLERARADLLGDEGATIAQIAHRWGFGHLGRFSRDYAAVYGVAPSRTRSSGAPRRPDRPGRDDRPR